MSISKHQSRPLFDALVQYSKSNVTPFDVPGHKMGIGIHKDFKEYVGDNIFKMDINSLKEMDNLSNPEGVIKEAEELAADLFDSDNAFFLVNGSTSGVQNMILSAVGPNDKILVPRNIHKSAINALVISGAIPIYIYPEIAKDISISYGISVEETKRMIDLNKDAKAILLLNPTYYGFSNDLKEIIEYAHKYDMIVLVDESHGTHFYLHDEFPPSSMSLGADMATISVHKTGGSLTQSSILLHNDGRIKKSKVRSVINLFQTSSASYLLMASIDIARHNLATNPTLIQNVLDLSYYAQKEVSKIERLKVMKSSTVSSKEHFDHDPSKLLIDVRGLGKSGFEIYTILKEEYNIQLEFGETYCILAIISVGDTKQSVDILINALRDISFRFKELEPMKSNYKFVTFPEVVKTPHEAFFSETEYLSIHDSVNKIAADQIMIYPPGIPLLNPGERVTKQIVDEYLRLINDGNRVIGSIKNGTIKIKVIKE
jgi:arginine/lysine/ornithine decarboxylase